LSFAAIFVETALAHVEIIRGYPGDEPGIVVRQTIIGNDELLLAFDFNEIWQIVVVGIGVVDERIAIFGDELARADARGIPTVPAGRRGAGRASYRFDSGAYARLLLFAIKGPMLSPPPPVRADIVPGPLNPLNRRPDCVQGK
jgi:hypothetical protein